MEVEVPPPCGELAVALAGGATAEAGALVSGTVTVPCGLAAGPDWELRVLLCGAEEVLWEDVLWEEYVDHTGHQRPRYQQRLRHHCVEAVEQQRVAPTPAVTPLGASVPFRFRLPAAAPPSIDCRFHYAAAIKGEAHSPQPIHWLARVHYRVVALLGTPDGLERWEPYLLRHLFTTAFIGTNAEEVPPPKNAKWPKIHSPPPVHTAAPLYNTAEVSVTRSLSSGLAALQAPDAAPEAVEATVHIKTLLFISRGQIQLAVDQLARPFHFGEVAPLTLRITNGSSVVTDCIKITLVREVALKDGWGCERVFVHMLHDTWYGVQCPARSELRLALDLLLSAPEPPESEEARAEDLGDLPPASEPAATAPADPPGRVRSLDSTSPLFGGDFAMRVWRTVNKPKTSHFTALADTLASSAAALYRIAYHLRVTVRVPWSLQAVTVVVPVTIAPAAAEPAPPAPPLMPPPVLCIEEEGDSTSERGQPVKEPGDDEQAWLLEFERELADEQQQLVEPLPLQSELLPAEESASSELADAVTITVSGEEPSDSPSPLVDE